MFACCQCKVDKIYLSAPQKVVIIDHEKKRTFVLRKDGLPDVGELGLVFSHNPGFCT